MDGTQHRPVIASTKSSSDGIADSHAITIQKSQGSKKVKERQGVFMARVAKRIQFYKTRLCPWLASNQCTRGDRCNYAHSEEELRTLPDLSCTRICSSILDKGSCGKVSCRFAHSCEALRATDFLYKTRICRQWFSGHCAADADCRMAHGEEDLRRNPILDFCHSFDNISSNDYKQSITTDSPLQNHRRKVKTTWNGDDDRLPMRKVIGKRVNESINAYKTDNLDVYSSIKMGGNGMAGTRVVDNDGRSRHRSGDADHIRQKTSFINNNVLYHYREILPIDRSTCALRSVKPLSSVCVNCDTANHNDSSSSDKCHKTRISGIPYCYNVAELQATGTPLLVNAIIHPMAIMKSTTGNNTVYKCIDDTGSTPSFGQFDSVQSCTDLQLLESYNDIPLGRSSTDTPYNEIPLGHCNTDMSYNDIPLGRTNTDMSYNEISLGHCYTDMSYNEIQLGHNCTERLPNEADFRHCYTYRPYNEIPLGYVSYADNNPRCYTDFRYVCSNHSLAGLSLSTNTSDTDNLPMSPIGIPLHRLTVVNGFTDECNNKALTQQNNSKAQYSSEMEDYVNDIHNIPTTSNDNTQQLLIKQHHQADLGHRHVPITLVPEGASMSIFYNTSDGIPKVNTSMTEIPWLRQVPVDQLLAAQPSYYDD